MSIIINLNGVMIELSRVKAIIHCDSTKSNSLKIELNKRKEYIFNPNIEKWEIQEYNDVINIEFPYNDIAVENYLELLNIWESELQNGIINLDPS
jgi:hypothetical protein